MTEKDKPITAADRVIAAFGTQAECARKLGISYQRVFSWTNTGRIPAKMQAKIMECAKKNKIKLKASDLVNV